MKQYFKLARRILKNSSVQERVRIRRMRELLGTTCAMTFLVGVPAVILILIISLFSLSKVELIENGAIWALPLLPIMFIFPLTFLCLYLNNYRKPVKNDSIITEKYKLVKTDSPIVVENDFMYTFCKDRFKFFTYFQPVEQVSKYLKIPRKLDVIHLHMIFKYSVLTFAECKPIMSEMVAYLEGKPIGQFIRVSYYSIWLRMAAKNISCSEVEKIVDEFLYLTKRFNLIPITQKEHFEALEQLQNEIQKNAT